MRTLFSIWLFLLLGGIVAIVARQDSGYVLISYGVWTVEMSLTLLIVAASVGFAGLYLLIRLLARTWQVPQQVRNWQQRRGIRLAQSSLTRGLLEMSEGNWEVGENYLVKDAEKSETPLLNYLAAARAAQLQGKHEHRDAYIRLAHEHMPSADVAVSLTQAELQLADRQLEQALATLKHLRGVAPKHIYVLRLLSRLYEQLGDWDHLNELLPELKKRKVKSAGELQQLEVRIHRALLEQASLSPEPTRLDLAWQNAPKMLHKNEQLLVDYVTYLKERDEDEKAEPLARTALKRNWNEQLAALYGLLKSEDPNQQLKTAEALLEKQAKNPVLLLALGRLSLKASLWGKARAYLEASIEAAGSPEAYRELGHLLEEMGEQTKALELYRRGMLGTGGPQLVPLPHRLSRSQARRPRPDEAELEVPPPEGARSVL